MNKVNTSNGTILVVDDNPMNLRVLLDCLKDANFRLLVARDGVSAIDQALRARPDIILLDIMMTGLDGYETCRKIKEEPRTTDIPVIFITALSDTIDKIKGFDAGGIDYITKPFQQEEVLARVGVHLQINNLKKQLEEKNKMLDEKNRILDMKNEILHELNAAKDRFFSIIAHDLKNPIISFISGTNMLIKQGTDPDEVKEISVVLHENAKKLNRLLEDLLHWAELQMKGMELHAKKVKVHEAIEGLGLLFQDQIRKKSLTLENRVPEDLVYTIDPNLLETVLRNILANAVKYTYAEGKIEIQSKQHDDFLEISISDDGVGIGKNGLDKLFKIESKYSTEGTKGEKGNGLGLIICRELLERIDGRIYAESEKGSGSVFTISLPLD